MRRFSLYRRGRIWYAQLYNPKTRRYTSGGPQGKAPGMKHHSWWPDGCSTESPSPGATSATQWGDPEVDTILSGIRNAALNGTDAEKIISALKDRELIETGVVKGS